MSSGIIPINTRTSASSGGGARVKTKPHKGHGRRPRTKRHEDLSPVAVAVAVQTLAICAKRIASDQTAWVHPGKGHTKQVKKQVVRLMRRHDVIDVKRFANPRIRERIERLVADIIVTDRLLKPTLCVGDPTKVVMGLSKDGEEFLAKKSLDDIRAHRARRQAERDKLRRPSGVVTLVTKAAREALDKKKALLESMQLHPAGKKLNTTNTNEKMEVSA